MLRRGVRQACRTRRAAVGPTPTTLKGRMCVPAVSLFSSATEGDAPPLPPTSTVNRWAVVVPAALVEMSMGSIYCASMWCSPLTRLDGVVTSAPGDFSIAQAVPILSMGAVGLAVCSTFLGGWIERVGPAKAGTVGAIAWFSGLMTCSAAAHLQSLPLLYCGYGVMGGLAWGLLYLTPVSTVMKWFPDKRGMATGITLSAFGAGAAFGPPLIEFFTNYYFIAPTLVGLAKDIALTTLADGTQVLASDGVSQVVVATASDAAKVGMTEGVYLVGTGDSGASGAFASLACIYGSVAAVCSQFMKAPPKGWVPEGFKVDQSTTAGTTIGLPADAAMRTPQFPLLWLTVFGNAVGGLALISSSKMVMTDIWGAALPGLVTATFATAYCSALGSANSFGRLTWAVVSDKLGRKNTYSTFALGLPVMASTPYLIQSSMGSVDASPLPLYIFMGGSIFAICNYGGIFSVLPAYIADLYGQKHSTAIHGKALTAWSASAVAGPMGLAWLRGRSELAAIEDLCANVDPVKFEQTFGTTLDSKASLIESKTLTISRLMEIVGPEVSDPTPYLYDTTFYAAAGFIGLAAVCNQLLKAPDVLKLIAENKKQKKQQMG